MEPRRCPACHTFNAVPIIPGLPGWEEPGPEAEVWPGGCASNPEATHHCTSCGGEFRLAQVFDLDKFRRSRAVR